MIRKCLLPFDSVRSALHSPIRQLWWCTYLWLHIFCMGVILCAFHHGMVRSQFEDREVGFHVWSLRLIYWISCGNTTKGGLPAWRLGLGLMTPHHKRLGRTKCYTGPGALSDSLERPKQKKMDVRFGTWTVRSPELTFNKNSSKIISEV